MNFDGLSSGTSIFGSRSPRHIDVGRDIEMSSAEAAAYSRDLQRIFGERVRSNVGLRANLDLPLPENFKFPDWVSGN